jgi:hypothetical protein
MRIVPQERTVEATLDSGFYVIPPFQRPYSWEIVNVEDLWNDIVVLSGGSDYFIGSFVVFTYETNPNIYYVVDGQQRLTTITLILAALRNQFVRLKLQDLADGIQRRIERQDIDNKLQYVLQSESPYPYLQEYIQKATPPELPATVSVENAALKEAFTYIEQKLRDDLAVVAKNVPPRQASKLQAQRCVDIRDRLLRLHVIITSLDNEDDAFQIFETLNTRGKDLRVSDLVKNLLARMIPSTNRNVNVAKERWRKIVRDFEESAVRLDIDKFLLHSWISRNPYTTANRLYRAIRGDLGTSKSKASTYLQVLTADAKLYRTIREPSTGKWKFEETLIRDALVALELFKVAQPLPLLLSILRSYNNGSLAHTQVTRSLMAMENFHAQFTAVSNQRTGGGTAMMYALPAKNLAAIANKDKAKDKASKIISGFIEKLEERVPNIDEFVGNFKELSFLESETRMRPIVFYILRRIDKFFSGNMAAPIDYTKMTIEHIASQKTAGIAHLGMIGNLVLVTEPLNVKLADKPVLEKQTLLGPVDIIPGDSIRTAKSWGDEEIVARTEFLARLAHEKVFKV